MPESPPASGPLRCSQAAGMAQTNARRIATPVLLRQILAQTVIHAASGRETDPKRPGSAIAGPRVADASESSAPYYPQPMPLPARTDAVPIRPDGPEVPILGEPPGSAPLAPPPGLNPLGRKIIERALPNSSAEERDAWHDTLKDLAPKDVREVMRLRQELGRMPPSVVRRAFPPAGQPLWSQADPRTNRQRTDRSAGRISVAAV